MKASLQAGGGAVWKISNRFPENPFDLPERCQAADRSRGSRCAPTDAMARTDPGQEGTLLLATLFSMATTFCLYKLLRQFKSTRRTLNKFVRLSKQGPFYRGGSWLLGTLMRRTRGTAAIAAPGERCVPRVRLNERTTSSVDLIWTAERASTWSDDAYELQRRWAPGHAGAFEARDTPEKIQAARDAVDEWVTVYQGARAQ